MLKITWEQEFDHIKDPIEAAKECRRDIINGNSLIFTVENTETGEKFSIDLSESTGIAAATKSPFANPWGDNEPEYTDEDMTELSKTDQALIQYAAGGNKDTTPPPPKATTVTQEQGRFDVDEYLRSEGYGEGDDAVVPYMAAQMAALCLKEEIKQAQDERDAFKSALINANDMLRSCHSVVERKGATTNWVTLENRIKERLKEQHQLIYQAPNPELSVATDDAQGGDAGNQKTPPPVRCEQQEGEHNPRGLNIKYHQAWCDKCNERTRQLDQTSATSCTVCGTSNDLRNCVKGLLTTPPAPPQQEGERLLQEVVRVIDTVRILNKREEDTTVIDAGLYKAQMIVFQVMDLLTTPSPPNGAIYNASEIQRLLTEQQNKH